MPHIHIFMQKKATEDLLSHTNEGYVTSDDLYVDVFVSKIVLDSFRKLGLELKKDQVVTYDLRVTNSMPVDMAVNVTAWFTPERAPHFKAIERDIAESLAEWAPRLDIEVRMIVVGAPQFSELATGIASLGSQLS